MKGGATAGGQEAEHVTGTSGGSAQRQGGQGGAPTYAISAERQQVRWRAGMHAARQAVVVAAPTAGMQSGHAPRKKRVLACDSPRAASLAARYYGRR